MARVKVCGLMNKEDIDICIQAGVHMLGFVVDYPIPVPWNLAKEQARELIHAVPPFVSTCAVTGGSAEKILEIVNVTCPNVVQLHYQETLSDIRKLASALESRGVKVIKALRIGADGNCDFEIPDPAMAARELAKTGVSAILVDSYTASMPGGTGVTVDLSVFLTVKGNSPLPIILAGGLNPDNIYSIVQKTHPYAVDVLTGVEHRPGRKDAERIKRFMENNEKGSYPV